MEQKITNTANRYKDLALMLDNFALEQPIDESAPEDVQAALVKLYYAKTFEAEIEKCEDFLEEDTDEEAVNSVAEAAAAAERASESALCVIEEFYSEDNEFAERLDGVTVSMESEEIFVKLVKLYKCEKIIRKAYRCSMRLPMYRLSIFTSDRQEKMMPI